MLNLAKLDNQLGRRLRQAQIKRALKHPDRLRIVSLLDDRGDMYLGDIFMNLHIGQRYGKKQITALRRAGILKVNDSRRIGIVSGVKDVLKELMEK